MTGMRAAIAAALVALAGPASAQGSGERVEFSVGEHPRVTIGPVSLDLKGRLDIERLGTSGREPAEVDVERQRLGVAGAVSDVILFEIERELDDEADPWRDVWVAAQARNGLLARAGKFKMPFSRAQMTSRVKHPFVNRPLAAEALAPGRQVGASVESGWIGRVVGLQAAWFRESVAPDPLAAPDAAGWTSAGAVRVNVRPFRRRVRALRDLEIGIGATAGDRPEGLASVEGRTLAGGAVYFPEVYVKGRRLRTGVDAVWPIGPVEVSGEYLRAEEDRREQGLRGEDLGPLTAEGWHLSGVWRVFGEPRERDLPIGFAPLTGSAGTLELVGRVERLRFWSAASGDPAFRNPRAAHVWGNADEALTVGANWYFSRFGRLQANLIGERIEDGFRSPTGSTERFWSVLTRLQLHL